MLRRRFIESLAAAPAALPWMRCAGAFAAQPGATAAAPFKPSEGTNNPIGTGKGIHPGRVVWTRDASAASWDGATGHWWDDANTDQKVVHQMTARLVEDLTGRKNHKQAWDALFRNFNETHRNGRSGYRPGERIAIKVNCNQDRSRVWGTGSRPLNGLPSPHVIVALVSQLIEQGGVRGEDILIFDATGQRNVGLPISRRILSNANRQYQNVQFLVGTDYDVGGRIPPEPDPANPVRFARDGVPVALLPKQVTEAKYLINIALLRPHGAAGVTLIGKNHFGCVYFEKGGGWSPRTLHPYVPKTQAMGSYNALVDLIGHRHLGGKSMLYMLDGLYTAEHNESNVFRWASFGDQWASSLLMSQDPLAIDSVGLDILSGEPRATQVRGNPDNYLHEGAQAAKPPSGTIYDPSGTGRLASLGVHEHWNNATGRKYSRNLGRKQGIELIASVA